MKTTPHGDILCLGLANLFERDAREIADKAPKFAKELTQRAKELLSELIELQNTDGGWGYVREGSSYAHTTGEVLYCLGVIGMGEKDVTVQKGWKYLVRSQQRDGWWHAPSRETFSTAPNKVHDPSIHWGTAWATIGLLQTLPKK